MRSIIRTILKGFGAGQVFEAGTVADGIRTLNSQCIDIAFVENVLGPEEGLEFVKHVRTAPEWINPNRFLPIIMLAPASPQWQVERARDAGVSEYCLKPISTLEVYRKVVKSVNHPRPFVQTNDYFGPDRRRQAPPIYKGPERRIADPVPRITPEGPGADLNISVGL